MHSLFIGKSPAFVVSAFLCLHMIRTCKYDDKAFKKAYVIAPAGRTKVCNGSKTPMSLQLVRVLLPFWPTGSFLSAYCCKLKLLGYLDAKKHISG